jgi:hypothetical protein
VPEDAAGADGSVQGTFGDDVGLLRIGELPTALAFVNANDLIFADIIMGKGSERRHEGHRQSASCGRLKNLQSAT